MIAAPPVQNRWSVALAGDPPVECVARLRDGWLLCDAAAPDCDPAAMLARNATLPPLWKLVPEADGRTRWRAELPLEDDGDAESALHGLAALFSAPQSGDAPTLDAVLQLCAEAGWPALSRTTHCRVELDSDAIRQASLTPRAEGLHVAIDLAPAVPCPAAATFLATAGARVRMARPAFADGRARLEILFPKLPTALQLDAACAALSVAAELCARETAALLGNETLASAYLASLARPTGARLQPQPPNGETT